MAPSRSYAVFSFSAPYVSQEDERRAKESLSEADLLQIHNDLFGIQNRIATTATNDDSSCTSARTCSLECSDREEDGKIEGEADNNFDQRFSNSFETSLREREAADRCERAEHILRRKFGHKLIRESLDLLPMELSDAYRVAIERNPSLLYTNECNWDYYLCKYNDDVWAAAEAIANYWTLRRSTFGNEQYYKCMTFEMDGCMFDIKKEFTYGGMRIDGYDNHGRPILYFDIKSAAKMHRDVAVQIAFFWVHQLIYNRYQLPYVATVNKNYNSISATSDANAVDGGSSIDANVLNKSIFHDCTDSSNHNNNNMHSSVGGIGATETLMPLPIDDLPTHPDFSYVALGNFKVCKM
jgi:hypothetical protein